MLWERHISRLHDRQQDLHQQLEQLRDQQQQHIQVRHHTGDIITMTTKSFRCEGLSRTLTCTTGVEQPVCMCELCCCDVR